MTAYYSGDINGVLWYGQQPSEPLTHLCAQQEIIVFTKKWKCCACLLEPNYPTYCRHCFTSEALHRELHRDIYGEFPIVDNQLNYLAEMIEEEHSLKYIYENTPEVISDLQYTLNEIVVRLTPAWLSSAFRFKGRNGIVASSDLDVILQDNINNYDIFPSDMLMAEIISHKFDLAARWVLGKRILACLNRTGHCVFRCILI